MNHNFSLAKALSLSADSSLEISLTYINFAILNADQISQIVTNIRTLYAQQTTYDGLNTATAIQMGIISDELDTVASQTSMGSGQSALTNAFGG